MKYTATIPEDVLMFQDTRYLLNLEGTVQLAEVPLPAAIYLMGVGFLGFLGWR